MSRQFFGHSPCPACGVDAHWTGNTGGKRVAPHIKFDGHTGPKSEKVICSQMIILRGQPGWPKQAEDRTVKERTKEGLE